MKQYLSSSIRLTLVCIVFFCAVYPAVIWLIAQAAPNHGQGQQLSVHGKIVAYTFVGQRFSDDKYFWSRPSAANYDASASVGSNKGPSNPDYLAQVQARIDTFAVHNSGIARTDIPAELVTASGSGLDPDLSPQAALIQVPRVAKARSMQPEQVRGIVNQLTKQPFLGMFGPSIVNVTKLNIALDEAQSASPTR